MNVAEELIYIKARSIAAEAHRGQVDKAGKDYFEHPMRVAARLTDAKAKVVAILHDTIEDTFVTPEYLYEQGFDKEIVDAVLSVTRNTGESYMEFIRRCAENPIGRIVKMEDLKDNMDITRLDKIRDEDIRRLSKYHKAYRYLVDYEKLKDTFWGFIETIDHDNEYEKWMLTMEIGNEYHNSGKDPDKYLNDIKKEVEQKLKNHEKNII